MELATVTLAPQELLTQTLVVLVVEVALAPQELQVQVALAAMVVLD